ncbi:MAG: biliverdin-producing heme oxygenase [bacterium]|nr:biliverdin-producing heme oxygenase [bacterium]
METLHGLIRAKTASAHARLEALPFFQALQQGCLPKPAIISLLRSLAIIHAVVERELSHVADSRVAEFARHVTAKVPLLMADLEVLDAAGIPSVTSAIRGALKYGAEILADADDPMSLVGVLYVLEGSQNGGITLKRSYAHCLRINEEKLLYFGCYGKDTAANWNSFTAGMNALELGAEQAQAIALSATRCFEGLRTICAELHPIAEDALKHHVTAINFEAGDHAMPQNPYEIELALRAGRTAWKSYPYLEKRFGDRGKRFTSSDSCWLVALTRMPTHTATRSLEWLRTVLASRGIPTIVLEGHLRAISRALSEEFPEHPDMSSRFGPFLAALDAERCVLDGGANISNLIKQYERRFLDCDGFTVASAAPLLVSAWIDERSGIAGAFAATRDWFADAARFSSHWINSVRAFEIELDRVGSASC